MDIFDVSPAPQFMGTCTAPLMSHFVTCLLISVVYIIALCSFINTTTFFSLYVHCCPVLDLTFDNIAAIAAGEQEKLSLRALVKVYEKDEVTQVLKFWNRCVLLWMVIADANSLLFCCPPSTSRCTGRDRIAIPNAPTLELCQGISELEGEGRTISDW
jgi:hypothetical protein